MLTCRDIESERRPKLIEFPDPELVLFPSHDGILGQSLLVKTHKQFHKQFSFFLCGNVCLSVYITLLHFIAFLIWLDFSPSHLTSLERPSLGDCLTVAHQLLLDRTFINSSVHISLCVSLLRWMNTYLHKHCFYSDILPLKPTYVLRVFQQCACSCLNDTSICNPSVPSTYRISHSMHLLYTPLLSCNSVITS